MRDPDHRPIASDEFTEGCIPDYLWTHQTETGSIRPRRSTLQPSTSEERIASDVGQQREQILGLRMEEKITSDIDQEKKIVSGATRHAEKKIVSDIDPHAEKRIVSDMDPYSEEQMASDTTRHSCIGLTIHPRPTLTPGRKIVPDVIRHAHRGPRPIAESQVDSCLPLESDMRVDETEQQLRARGIQLQCFEVLDQDTDHLDHCITGAYDEPFRHLLVKTPFGKVVRVGVLPDHTIMMVKQMISVQTTLSEEHFRLVYLEKPLENGHTLLHYGVEAGSIIRLVLPEKIHIEVPIGHSIAIDTIPEDTIGMVKEVIQSVIDVPIPQQRLRFRSQCLNDGQSLRELGIERGMVICLEIVAKMPIWKKYVARNDKYDSKDSYTAGSSPPPTIRVYVKTLASCRTFTGVTIPMDVTPEDTVLMVKELTCLKSGIPVCQQRLVYAGKLLLDSEALGDQGVGHEDTICMAVALRGGGGGTWSPPRPIQPGRPTSPAMQIFVKMITSRTITIDVHPDDLIEDVKLIIMGKEPLPIDSQRLVYAGKQLQNHMTLRDYNIQKDTTIFLILRLAGGGREGPSDTSRIEVEKTDVGIKNGDRLVIVLNEFAALCRRNKISSYLAIGGAKTALTAGQEVPPMITDSLVHSSCRRALPLEFAWFNHEQACIGEDRGTNPDPAMIMTDVSDSKAYTSSICGVASHRALPMRTLAELLDRPEFMEFVDTNDSLGVSRAIVVFFVQTSSRIILEEMVRSMSKSRHHIGKRDNATLRPRDLTSQMLVGPEARENLNFKIEAIVEEIQTFYLEMRSLEHEIAVTVSPPETAAVDEATILDSVRVLLKNAVHYHLTVVAWDLQRVHQGSLMASKSKPKLFEDPSAFMVPWDIETRATKFSEILLIPWLEGQSDYSKVD